MYMTESIKQDFADLVCLKDLEKMRIFDKISDNNLVKLLYKSDIKSAEVSYNHYGEFMFVHFVYKNKPYFVFGLGMHEYRQKVYREFWQIESANSFIVKEPTISLFSVCTKIKQRQVDVDKYLDELKPTKESAAFNLVADIADDDYAYVALRDGELNSLM